MAENLMLTEFSEIPIGTIKSLKNYQKSIWLLCEECEKPRWVRLYKGQPRAKMCFSCTGKDIARRIAISNGYIRNGQSNGHWKGGKYIDKYGYVWVWLPLNDFFRSMTRKHTSYIREHRLIMAKYLGRCLESWETVHHKNGIKNDNRVENLEIFKVGSHIKEHNKGYQEGYQKGLIDGVNIQIQELKIVIEELKKEIKILQSGTKQVENKNVGRMGTNT
ncbi:MAG: HNH endonuclease [Ignavibacteria bacterium]|nr:HNH endonuclease [Ignavibacteria bacterium]